MSIIYISLAANFKKHKHQNFIMKLKSLLILILAIVSLSGTMMAQKNVNVDNLRFSYLSRELPKNPQDPMFFYYSTKINMAATLASLVDEAALYENLFISGQRLTEEPKEDDIFVEVKMNPINIVSSEVKERVVENKNKEGKVTSRNYYYWVEVAYTFDATAVISKAGTVIKRYTMYNSSSRIYHRSQEYTSRKSASDYWNNNRDMLREQFSNECAKKAISDLSFTASNEFGFAIMKTSGLIKTINEKKHPENETLRANSDALKSRMEALTGETPLTEEDMADLIEYFKSIPERYTDPKLKADVRLRYVAYYNLCRIYMYIDQPEKVKEWADLLFANGHDKKDAERLTKDADKLIERFNNSIIKTTQFSTDSYFEEN